MRNRTALHNFNTNLKLSPKFHDFNYLQKHKLSYWNFVRAQEGDRGAMIKSRDIFVILRTKKYKKLIENLQTEKKDTNHFKMSKIVDAMPHKERKQMVMPSIRGEHLTIKKVRGYEDSNGRTNVEKSSGFSSNIPVEYVIEPLTYDEVVVELIDQKI